MAHTPPHPSSPPQAALAQFGVQPHTPACPPPPQVSGLLHPLPAQHVCPLPPHAPQLELPQASPLAHAWHTVPPIPHALEELPGSHVETSQHPLHELPSHTHTPVVQCWPLPHEPCWHAPPHPSSAPHALPAQLGVHPHAPARPPPPHCRGAVQLLPAQQG